MKNQSESTRRCSNCESNGKQSATCALRSINSTDIITHLRNQEIISVVIVHLLERIDKTLRQAASR